jgi:hypothetical protein
LESLGHLFATTSPEAAAVIRIIEMVTLGALTWLLIYGVDLYRQMLLLRQVRRLFSAEPLLNTSPWEFADKWSTVKGAQFPHGLVTARVRALAQVKASGLGGAESLRLQTEQRLDQQSEVPRYLAGTLVLLGLAGTVWGLGTAAGGVYPLLQRTHSLNQLQQLIQPMTTIMAGMRSAFACTAAGLVGTLLLSVVNLAFSQFQRSFVLQLEEFSVTVLEPRILCSEEDVTAQRFARVLEECSRRFETAIRPFASGLDRYSEQLSQSAGDFANRLENSSHNVLQSVEGMRNAATELREGAASLDGYYAKIEAMYRNVETMASQVAGSQVRQQERLDDIAGELFGITQSLTTVVAGANESQQAAAHVAKAVSDTAGAVKTSADRLGASAERFVAALESVPLRESVPSKDMLQRENGSAREPQTSPGVIASPGIAPERDGQGTPVGLEALSRVVTALAEVAHSNGTLQRTLDARLGDLSAQLLTWVRTRERQEPVGWRRWLRWGEG